MSRMEKRRKGDTLLGEWAGATLFVLITIILLGLILTITPFEAPKAEEETKWLKRVPLLNYEVVSNGSQQVCSFTVQTGNEEKELLAKDTLCASFKNMKVSKVDIELASENKVQRVNFYMVNEVVNYEK